MQRLSSPSPTILSTTPTTPVSLSFAELAQTGKVQWWRYLLGVVIILVFWLLLGQIPFIVAVVYAISTNKADPGNILDGTTIRGIGQLLNYVVINLTFWFFLGGVFLATVGIHRRKFRTLVTPRARINWYRIGLAASLWILLQLGLLAIHYVLSPDNYRLTFNPVAFVTFLPFVLLLTPIQTTTEELFFRGYLLQGTRRLTGSWVVIALVNGVLFLLPHLGNPEVGLGFVPLALYYFSFGVLMAWITLRTNSAEIAIGTHMANNLFAALVVTFKESALQTPAILTVKSVGSPWISLLEFLIVFAILAFVLLRFFPVKETEESPAVPSL